MFFLLRMAFWFGLILLLLPLSLGGKDGQSVGMFDALGVFQAAVSDARGFCDRQPQACAVGGQMIGHLGEKAQYGAKWLYEAIGPAEGQGAAPAAAVAGSHAAPAGVSGTLTPQDLAPAWGGTTGSIPGAAAHPAMAPAAPAAPAPLPQRRPA